MKIDGFLRILWQYPNLPERKKGQLDKYSEYAIKRALDECNSFYMYAAHMMSLVCYQRNPNQTIENMQHCINQECYPENLGVQLALELIEILFNEGGSFI